jgi:hypothetical protein
MTALLLTLALLAPAKPQTRSSDLEALVADLTEQVAELRREVRELQRRVDNQELAKPAEPLPDHSAIAEAVRRGEIVVGMTLEDIRRARPKWGSEPYSAGAGYETLAFGERIGLPGSKRFAHRVLVTLRGGRVMRVVQIERE